MSPVLPVIVGVDDNDQSRQRLEDELTTRYGASYRIVIETSAADALGTLRSMQTDDTPVAIVLARLWMTDASGLDVLAETRELHPRAKRAVLIPWAGWGDHATATAIRSGVASGVMDYYLLEPWKTPDETFHRTIAEFLYEWVKGYQDNPTELTLIAERGSARGAELRNLLTRNGLPHTYLASDSEVGQARLAALGLAETTAPVVSFIDGGVLVDPSNRELAEAYGVHTSVVGSSEVDVAIIGAGPAGLAAAVYGSSEGLNTLVIERESIGGQAGSSSMIRNYLGFSRGISGADLAQRAYQQAWVFGAQFLSMTEVASLESSDGWHTLTMGDGTSVRARAVILAMGVAYTRLGLPTLEGLVGRGVFYGASPSEAKQFEGRDVFLVGAGNSAGQAALNLGKWARHVTLLVRGDSLAKKMSAYLIDALGAATNVEVRMQTHVIDGTGENSLETITLQDDAAGTKETVPADALFVMIGASPHTQWLPDGIAVDKQGFIVTGSDLATREWELPRVPFRFETSAPGVFAVGDVRYGSMKRVASGVGEGAVALQEVQQYLELAP